jgi:hypothetical protein
VYIDIKAKNAAKERQKLGGAKVIMAAAPNSRTMSELIGGIVPSGRLLVIGAAFDPIEATPSQLITGSKIMEGWTAGTPADSVDTLRFAELRGVRDMIETDSPEQTAEARPHDEWQGRMLTLPATQLKSSLSQQTYRARVQADFAGGVRSGVNGTPTFFVNGLRHNGPFGVSSLSAAIERSLSVDDR